MRSGFYRTSWEDQLSGWMENKLQSTSQSQTCTKKKKKKGHGHCLEICCWSDPLQLFEFQQNHYIWEDCSANQWDAPISATPASSISQQKRTQLFSMTMPDCTLHNQCFKRDEWIGLWSFASSAIFTWPLANWLALLQAFWHLAWKMFPQLTGDRKCFPGVHQIPKHGFLHYRSKPTYFSSAKMCWL